MRFNNHKYCPIETLENAKEGTMGGLLRISLVPPHGWKEISLNPADRERQIRQILNPLRHVVADWSEVYPVLRRCLVASYDQSWKAGVRYAITTDMDGAGAVLVMAAFMVSILPAIIPYSTADEEIDAIVESVSKERESLPEGDEMYLEKTGFKELGPAVSVSSMESVRDDHGKVIGHFAILRTFIPCGGKIILTTGITPQIELSDTLFQLFTKITATLRVVSEEEDIE